MVGATHFVSSINREVSSITSDEALANPYAKGMTIAPAFLKFPYLETVITDTHFGRQIIPQHVFPFSISPDCYSPLSHFGWVLASTKSAVTRDRMGRMLTMMARVIEDVASPPVNFARAIGTDEHTALLLDTTTGDVTAVGVGTSYVCTGDHHAEVCKSKTPLTFQSRNSCFTLDHC